MELKKHNGERRGAQDLHRTHVLTVTTGWARYCVGTLRGEWAFGRRTRNGGTGSESCPLTGCDSGSVEPLDSLTIKAYLFDAQLTDIQTDMRMISEVST
jgi:hypothetical protein